MEQVTADGLLLVFWITRTPIIIAVFSLQHFCERNIFLLEESIDVDKIRLSMFIFGVNQSIRKYCVVCAS